MEGSGDPPRADQVRHHETGRAHATHAANERVTLMCGLWGGARCGLVHCKARWGGCDDTSHPLSRRRGRRVGPLMGMPRNVIQGWHAGEALRPRQRARQQLGADAQWWLRASHGSGVLNARHCATKLCPLDHLAQARYGHRCQLVLALALTVALQTGLTAVVLWGAVHMAKPTSQPAEWDNLWRVEDDIASGFSEAEELGSSNASHQDLLRQMWCGSAPSCDMRQAALQYPTVTWGIPTATCAALQTTQAISTSQYWMLKACLLGS